MWSPHVPDVVSTVLKYPIPHALFMNNPKKRRTLLVLSMALFTDAFVHGIFVPILPIGLHDRTPVEDNNIQKWTATILAGQGIGNLLLGGN